VCPHQLLFDISYTRHMYTLQRHLPDSVCQAAIYRMFFPLCHSLRYHAILYIMVCYVVLRFNPLRYAMLGCGMSCHVMTCCVMLRYVTLDCTILC